MMQNDYVTYYKIYQELGAASSTFNRSISQLVAIVESEAVAKAICLKEIGFSYIKVEVNKADIK